MAPPAGFEPAPPPPEGGALSPELRGLGLHEATSHPAARRTRPSPPTAGSLPRPGRTPSATARGGCRCPDGPSPGCPSRTSARSPGTTPGGRCRAGRDRRRRRSPVPSRARWCPAGRPARLAGRDAVLRGERPVGVGQADVLTEPALVDVVQPDQPHRRVGAQPVPRRERQRAQDGRRQLTVRVRRVGALPLQPAMGPRSSDRETATIRNALSRVPPASLDEDCSALDWAEPSRRAAGGRRARARRVGGLVRGLGGQRAAGDGQRRPARRRRPAHRPRPAPRWRGCGGHGAGDGRRAGSAARGERCGDGQVAGSTVAAAPPRPADARAGVGPATAGGPGGLRLGPGAVLRLHRCGRSRPARRPTGAR